MDYNLNLILIFLFLGGVIGWSLLVYIVLEIVKCRRSELDLINELKIEISEVRKEVQSLK